MYIQQSDACDVPNSQTPVSSTAIQRSQAFLDAMNKIVASANAGMSTLIQRPDLNRAGMPANSTPVSRSFDSTPVPAVSSHPLRLDSWPSMCVGNGGSLADVTPRQVSNIAVPPGKMPSLTVPPVGGPPPTPAPAAAPVKCGPMPTTGNVCIDLQKEYILQNQVSPKQLQDCIDKEYFLMGSKGRLTADQQRCQNENFATLPKIPDQPNVPKYSKSMGLAEYRSALVNAYRRSR